MIPTVLFSCRQGTETYKREGSEIDEDNKKKSPN